MPQWKVLLRFLGKSEDISEHMDGSTFMVGHSHTVSMRVDIAVKLGLETAPFHRIMSRSYDVIWKHLQCMV